MFLCTYRNGEALCVVVIVKVDLVMSTVRCGRE